MKLISKSEVVQMKIENGWVLFVVFGFVVGMFFGYLLMIVIMQKDCCFMGVLCIGNMIISC